MIIKEAVLETVCGITSKLPDNSRIEIALAGKSNVGKSSFINCMLNRKALARTSSEPGKTRTINFYRINDLFYFVDLPGYGFARVSQEEREKWGVMINRYLEGSKMLKAVFMLVDIRHDPGTNDKTMYDWIRSRGYDPVIIATKADKIKRSQLAKQAAAIRRGLGMQAHEVCIPFSSESGQGREEVWDYIEMLVTPQEEQSGV
jgi:GTP-binding protein